MNMHLTRCIVILAVSLILLTPASQARETQEEPAGDMPAYAVRRVYLGAFRGHAEEVTVLRNMLTNALLEEGFAVVENPAEADFQVEGEMGFQDAWGEYTKSRNYRVHSTLHVKNPEGNVLWQHSFVKKPKCSRKCFRKIAEKTVADFRKKAGNSTSHLEIPDNPRDIPPLRPL